MPYYVEERIVAKRTLTIDLEFECGGCGFASKVVAIGIGRGQARNPLLLDTGADERAGDQALYAAHRSAREAVRLVRCPRCGDRDRSAHRRFWLLTGLKLVALAAIPAAVGAMFMLAGEDWLGWALLAVGGPAAVLASYFFDARPRFRSAEARVAFEPSRLQHRRRLEPTAAACFER
jgi:hypothetical protein